jgi:hypothetical protein
VDEVSELPVQVAVVVQTSIPSPQHARFAAAGSLQKTLAEQRTKLQEAAAMLRAVMERNSTKV